MVHAASREAALARVEEIAALITAEFPGACRGCDVLFSSGILKKTGLPAGVMPGALTPTTVRFSFLAGIGDVGPGQTMTAADQGRGEPGDGADHRADRRRTQLDRGG